MHFLKNIFQTSFKTLLGYPRISDSAIEHKATTTTTTKRGNEKIERLEEEEGALVQFSHSIMSDSM